MQGAVMLQALLMAVTNNGQRSRRNGHEASARHSHTLLHAIQYAAPLWESFCMDSNARSSGGMIFVSGYDIAHRTIKAYGWSSESGCAEVYVTVINNLEHGDEVDGYRLINACHIFTCRKVHFSGRRHRAEEALALGRMRPQADIFCSARSFRSAHRK
jgi:hypothetical protein